ncbi:MAG: exonuclease SbcCD subunit D [Lachnospiraceae bacterium]|jgi:exonuclease SbcD|nr:exonuclease SbcCD subunit D [Lachnospiraceae bacterium]
MKLLHISDLHIGKRVCEMSMIEDQKYILRQILSAASDEQADGILLAGDIYDKPVPPAEAVQVFDRFLTELAGRNIPVLAVSGNHDSPERLSFGARLMSSRGVYLSPVYDGKASRVSLYDEWGEVRIHLLPFLKPAYVRHATEEEVSDYQEAVAVAVNRMDVDTSCRNILVAHQFVTGALRCESEEVTVGGLDQVDASLFDDFDYVALGHLHSPQSVGRKQVRYSGSPLKYSFSEAGQTKSITVAELGPKGEVSLREIPLIPLKEMRRLRGSYLEVMARSFYEDFDREDYIHMTLTDEEDIPDAVARLRVIYPNLMQLQYDNKRTRYQAVVEGEAARERRSEQELFEAFYELQNNQAMSEKQREYMIRLIRELKEGGGDDR